MRILEIVDEVTTRLIDGLDGVTFAIDGNDFVGDKSNCNEENRNKGNGKGKLDKRETFFIRPSN